MLACGCGPRLYPVMSSLVCVGFFCAGPVRAAVLFWVAGALAACAWCFVVYCVFTGFPCGGTVCCGVLCSGGWGVVIRGGVVAWAGRAREAWRGRAGMVPCVGWVCGCGFVAFMFLHVHYTTVAATPLPLFYFFFFFVVCLKC